MARGGGQDEKSPRNRIEIPKIELPRGGGATRAIDDKFQVNSANGTSSFSVPLPFHPGRDGFGPALSLGYDSGGGMGPFGLGWSLDLPSISRATGKRLPRYDDAAGNGAGSDDFQLTGFDDLVPAMRADGTPDIEDVGGYRIQRYRPRIEGTFARIERIHKTGEVAAYWRVMPGDGTTTVYGRSAAARIFDPEAPHRVLRWLPEWRFDDRGNCFEYRYKAEDLANVPGHASEALRRDGDAAYANRHLKRILHCNRIAYVPGDDSPPHDPPPPAGLGYFFQALFDYGEHDDDLDPIEARAWMARGDAWSDRRGGFDLRNNRLCRRIVFYNRFEELDPGQPDPAWMPTKGIEFDYAHADFSQPAAAPVDCETLLGIAEVGYRPDGTGGLGRTALPPMRFAYHPATMDATVHRSTRADLPNAPSGLMGEVHAIDLYGDGAPGLLTEVGSEWLYARNLGNARFERARPVWSRPSFAGIAGGTLQVRDLDADGSKQVVIEQPGLAGYFELEEDARAFAPMVAFARPAVMPPGARRKLIDLDGDGRPEIVIAGEHALHYLENRGREGYGRWCSAAYPAGEGPQRLLFADESEGIHLADMTGDGLSDLVRVRCDSIAYWPNLGHGRFGPLVRMDRSPVLDAPERFDPRRVQFADLGGSGAADLVYDADTGPVVALNFAGNGWGPTTRFPGLAGGRPGTQLTVADLLAQGTPCLVRASSLAADAGAPLAWIDLYGGRRPNLLAQVDNGAGKTVSIHYRSSVQLQLEDEMAGRPWITRLAFPVQCVVRTETRERVTNSLFVSTYRYRHGYYDHADREFRGFAFVEEIDTESYSALAGSQPGNAPAPELHEAPTRTRHWYHTGAFPGWSLPERLADEFAPLPAAAAGLNGRIDEASAIGSPVDRLRAHRVLKGKPLRTEVCALDGSAEEERPYRISTHGYAIHLVQARGDNRYGVYQATETESVEIHMERDDDDPRIAHRLTLAVDDHGIPLRAAEVAYARAIVPAGLDAEVADAQRASRITIRTLRNIPDLGGPAFWRKRMMCETATYELTGANPGANPGAGPGVVPGATHWTPAALDAAFLAAAPRDYASALPAGPARRLIELERVLLADDSDPAMPPLPLATPARRGIVRETYKLAFDATLRQSLYGADIADADLAAAHYVAQADLVAAGLFPAGEPARWWTASGHVEYGADPAAAFFRPIAYIDPVGQRTEVREYRDYFLLLDRIRDAAGNDMTVTGFDFHVVAPREVRDINGNVSAVAYDRLGLVAGSAVMGKGAEADTLAGFVPDLDGADIDAFFADPLGQARALLGRATTRVVSDHRHQPNWSAVIGRAMHDADEVASGTQGQLQIAFDYTDGLGAVVLRKLMTEPGEALAMVDTGGGPVAVRVDSGSDPRWVGSGRKVCNNKGRAVLEFNPYFALDHGYDDADALVAAGRSKRSHYDAFGRLTAVDHPDGSREETRIAAWSRARYDRNDLVAGSVWRVLRIGGARGPAAQAAAVQTDLHADTPAIEHVDALGHVVARIDHNRFVDRITGLPVDESLITRSRTDIEGNLIEVVDPRGIAIVRHAYDMVGTRAISTTADGGRRWRLSDALGKIMLAGDAKNNRIRIVYDAMQRPSEFRVRPFGGAEFLRERHRYGTAAHSAVNANGRLLEVFDGAGTVATPRYDFKGNVLETRRRFLADPRLVPDWSALPAPALAAGAQTTLTVHDALNRLTALTAPDGSVETYAYNETNLVETVAVAPAGGAPVAFVEDIDYDAKGQRNFIRYGNGVETDYAYDADTDRVASIRTRRLADGAVLQQLAYTYDPVGNVTAIVDGALPTHYFNNVAVDPGGSFAYDAIYRLASATGREHAAANTPPDWSDAPRMMLPHKTDGDALQRYRQSFEYDRSGNLVRIEHHAGRGAFINAWTRTLAYAAASNRLESSTVGAAPPETFVYDVHGNTLSMPHLGGLDWDEDNRLIRVRNNAGDKVWYGYDGEGNRVRKFVEHADGSTEDRIYVGRWERIEHRRADASLRVARETLHVLDGQTRIATIERRTAGADTGPASLTCYQFGNALGTAVLELDEHAQIHSYEEYHPFGTTALQSVSTLRRVLPKRYRFTGKERDTETGLYYHGARYYAPWLCRWTAPDPAGAADGQNLYAYSGNRPIGSSDPTGLWETPSWRTVAIVAAVVVVGAVVTVATAGVAGPVIAGAVASVGLTGTAATVATGVAVGAVSGAVAGAASGAAGEVTRQTVNSRALGLGNQEFSGRAILREAGSGAVTGAAVGAAIGGAAAFAGTAAGAAAIGAAGRAATAATRAVVPAAIRSGASTAARTVASAAGSVARTSGGQVVRRGVEAVGRRMAAIEAGAAQRGLSASRAMFRPGSAGLQAAESQAARSIGGVRIAASESTPSGSGSLLPTSSLNPRQAAMHGRLPTPGSTAVVPKRAVSMSDLRAIGRVTGDEYNMFTIGSRRLIVRGVGREITVSEGMYKDLVAGRYGRWSGHTHPPGYAIDPSTVDRSFMGAMGQQRSGIWGDAGHTVYGLTPADDARIMADIRRAMNERWYGSGR
ncbi:SpvB/TcaC N-terminal domain-containing protein [Lysobacter hankyongensis]|uniref:Toxin n=1 Tax=Lysobacter hankyongensis TaxID=1176535 RepID=A0ABP9C2W0_9GAMM